MVASKTPLIDAVVSDLIWLKFCDTSGLIRLAYSCIIILPSTFAALYQGRCAGTHSNHDYIMKECAATLHELASNVSTRSQCQPYIFQVKTCKRVWSFCCSESHCCSESQYSFKIQRRDNLWHFGSA